MTSLERQCLPGNTLDAVLHVISAVQVVAVGDLAGPEVALGGDVLAAAIGHIANGGESIGLGVPAKDDLTTLGILEDGGLNTDLGAHAGIDARRADGQVVVVIDVYGAEADRGVAGVDVKPVVVSVGNVELALVLRGVAVRVTNQRGLPLMDVISTSPSMGEDPSWLTWSCRNELETVIQSEPWLMSIRPS